MNAIKYALPLMSALLLGACVTVPTSPSVVALPGSNKTFDQFQADSFACQQFAYQSVGGTAEQANNYAASNAVAGSNAYYGGYYEVQRRYDGAYMQCMYAKGNQIPVRGAAPYRAPAHPYYGPPA